MARAMTDRRVDLLILDVMLPGEDGLTLCRKVRAESQTPIEDDGPGISDAQKQNMLEPFVRGDDARNMDEAAGFGLGLSITNAIVLAHGGTLSLHDRPPHGLVVRMQLPTRQNGGRAAA
jgi:signal transduction histidine kinase